MKWCSHLLLSAAFTAASVAGFGYWHATTHATFDVHLAYRTETGAVNRMRNGQLEFLDADGSVLARASIDTRRSVVWLAHPDKGQCGPDRARDAYQDCIKTQATWIPQWARGVRHANVVLGRCSLARRQVQLNMRRDSLWLWWMPLQHIGGLPYTRYSATIAVDTRGCQ